MYPVEHTVVQEVKGHEGDIAGIVETDAGAGAGRGDLVGSLGHGGNRDRDRSGGCTAAGPAAAAAAVGFGGFWRG